MKKCPFCAEEIQDEAIKCRFCNSSLGAAPGGAPAPSGPAPTGGDAIRGVAARADAGDRKVLYSGSPSWRAYFAQYFWITVAAVVAIFVGMWIVQRSHGPTGPATGAIPGSQSATPGTTLVLIVLIPVVLAALGYAFLYFFRRSDVFRITTSNIETEHGFLSKRIDVLELWRCRDVRYVQSLLDRILGIAHIEVTTTDVTTPKLTLVGLPASRQLFEKIRDSIELQRQHRNVVGMVS